LFIAPVCNLNTNEKVVALTFDDGPSPKRTPALLELLAKHGVKATFFMTGERMTYNPDIARAAFQQGHLIGNHSYQHVRLIFKTPSAVEFQIDKADSLIVATGQKESKYFRPPFGDKLIILPWLLKKKGKTFVNFDIPCPSQYASPLNVSQSSDEIIQSCKPGSIILLHDGWDRDVEGFLQLVETSIMALKKQGYRFVRIDEFI
jgi:peptidoglycan/xylan/chitin deacetylase (PgdA/CDA1 family)